MPAPRNKNILLVNPWITDFAAYDFWFKPLGLLYIGAVLRQLGYSVQLLDCLDRFHPELANYLGARAPKSKADFSGKFFREIIDKPKVLAHIPRFYARYGWPYSLVEKKLAGIEPPAVILVTSFMTYWYPGVVEAINLLRQIFPQTPIVLGGIYATLCPGHTKAATGADYVIAGEAEVQAVRLVAQLTGGPGDFTYASLDELPFPAFDLYSQLKSVPLLTSRGCPMSCDFCASRLLTDGYRRRSVENVFDEISHLYFSRQVQHFSFFDDALLVRANAYLKPLLRRVIDSRLPLAFYTPNGLSPRYIDEEMAGLFYAANVKLVRLSFETSDPVSQQKMSGKVTNAELEKALHFLENAGYNRKDIGVYVMMGLPGQNVAEARDSVLFVHNLGARVNLVSFSPIPGTQAWRDAVAAKEWRPDNDLLLTNTSIYPLWSRRVGYAGCEALNAWAKTLNDEL